jgi:hypothetical protein
LSVFYAGYTGGAYSYIYNGDLNRDGTSGHELMYIPKSKSELLWSSDEDANAYFAFAKQDPYLSKHAGEFAQRNAAHEPFYSRIDVRLLQDIKINIKGSSNKIQISADVINFANMLNSNWGLNKGLISNANSPLTVVGKDATTGMLKVSTRKIGTDYIKTAFQDPTSVSGTWGLQLGLRYIFN